MKWAKQIQEQWNPVVYSEKKKIKDALKNNRSVKNPSASNFFIDNTEEIQKLVFHE